MATNEFWHWDQFAIIFRILKYICPYMTKSLGIVASLIFHLDSQSSLFMYE